MASGLFLPPAIDCRPLPAFRADSLAAVRAAFGGATAVPLQQAWRDVNEPDFAPGIVRTGWGPGALLVFAELTDRDIFTRAERHNDRFWQLGDTFEMFLQPDDEPAYVELHVTPSNLRLQLRFSAPPTSDAASGDPFETSLIRADVFHSRTWIASSDGLWCVLATIPWAVVTGQAPASQLGGGNWRFSFSRYDYTRGREQPVISSTSPHAQPAFHRPDEWGTLRFGEPDSI